MKDDPPTRLDATVTGNTAAYDTEAALHARIAEFFRSDEGKALLEELVQRMLEPYAPLGDLRPDAFRRPDIAARAMRMPPSRP